MLMHRWPAWLAVSLVVCLSVVPQAQAGMVDRPEDVHGFYQAFDITKGKKVDCKATMVSSSVPGNIFYPDDQPSFTFQLENVSGKPIQVTGKVELIHISGGSIPEDMWSPLFEKIAVVDSQTLPVDLAAGAWKNFTVKPNTPQTKGGYALILDLGQAGRQFLTCLVRAHDVTPMDVQYPKQALEMMPPEILGRLGVQAVRFAVSYQPTDSKQYAQFIEQLDDICTRMKQHKITAVFEVGAGSTSQPLGKPRPHLDDDGVMLNTKADHVWLPEMDDDYQQFVYNITARYGWPKGPMTGMMLWNEPWEGISISGWGADMLRYRELYRRMGDAIFKARDEAGVDVLIGGCDSSTNTWDKLFPEGIENSPFWPKYLDFCSIHYQGMTSPALYDEWNQRTYNKGRVKIWDTESWVANTDDRFLGVVAANRAAGYDRALGVMSTCVIMGVHHDRYRQVEIQTSQGRKRVDNVANALPLAATIAASQHFIGEREFDQILFKNGLPWVFVFKGIHENPDDGTVVVLGNLDELFHQGQDIRASLFHSVKLQPGKAKMILDANNQPFALYDFYGNIIPDQDGKITIPLSDRGYFLRADPKVRGSFDQLLAALNKAQLQGMDPVEILAYDMTSPINNKPTLKLRITNQRNEKVTGKFSASLGQLQLDYPRNITLKAREQTWVTLKVTAGQAVPANRYPLDVRFDSVDGLQVAHQETMRVNYIAKRQVKVDGKLDDWQGVLPQGVQTDKAAVPSFEDKMWLPFAEFDQGQKGGLATAYMAYDDQHFYFAAKVSDPSQHPGAPRFANHNDDDYFYPEVSYERDGKNTWLKRDVNWSTDTRLPYALLKPGSKTERSYTGWESVVDKFAIEIDLPKDRLTQVAFYLVDWDHYREGRTPDCFTIIDRDTNKQLDERVFKGFGDGVYAVYALSGNIRIIIKSDIWWLRCRLSGIFIDPMPQAVKSNVATAQFLKTDKQTDGNWQGNYGSQGYHVFGTPSTISSEFNLQTPVKQKLMEHRWPEGVRRFSYRKNPVFPSGQGRDRLDNVQIAFNVIPLGKDGYLDHLPGRMDKFISYRTTDYEYALNKVSGQYGGGTEIWRLIKPGMPVKQYYPRQPKCKNEGAVENGKLAIMDSDKGYVYECAIPWSEIPDVRKALDRGQTIKFSYRVNNNGGPTMELGQDRSAPEGLSGSFHPDWVSAKPNEIEFGFER